MTANQIAYHTLQETKRSNTAKEAETQRHNMSDEAIRSDANKENVRHNMATEELTRAAQIETERSNKAKEAETSRHNMRTESEDERHNRQTESNQIQVAEINKEASFSSAMIGATGNVLGSAVKALNPFAAVFN